MYNKIGKTSKVVTIRRYTDFLSKDFSTFYKINDTSQKRSEKLLENLANELLKTKEKLNKEE